MPQPRVTIISSESLKEWLLIWPISLILRLDASLLKPNHKNCQRAKFFFEIQRPKKPLLPKVLVISQVEKLFAQLKNLKHETMLYLAYSAVLRVSEVINLKVKDIHSARMVINISGAKGKKDRIVALSVGILDLMRK